LLIDSKDKQIIPALRQLLKDTTASIPLIHALWTLEGLNALQPSDILPLLQQNDWIIRMQALTVLPSILNKYNYRPFLPVLKTMLGGNDTLAAPYLGFLAHSIQPLDPAQAHSLLLDLTRKYENNSYVADAIISNLYNKEEAFYKEALAINPDTGTTFNHRLKSVITDIAKAKNSSNLNKLAKKYPRGATLFQSVCQTCHGADGNGINALAPPLNGSNWVQGDKNQLIPIVLYGLTGPVKVAGHLYKSPEINGDMPGIGSNGSLSDEDIAQVLSFIRNAWNNKAPKINAVDIANTRKKFSTREKAFTTPELDQ
jgi:mono/diheme cytochrome c family protein